MRTLGTLILLLASACGSSGGPAVAESADTPEDALVHYEEIRAALARDDGEAVPAAAQRLAAAAQLAAADASAPTALPLQELAVAAEALEAVPAADLEAQRLAFGEVSRAVVGLLINEPSLAEGRYIFRCPMARGYKKWVQATPGLENPYMGTRMLGCGTETRWAQ